jgi:hypothetical protein
MLSQRIRLHLLGSGSRRADRPPERERTVASQQQGEAFEKHTRSPMMLHLGARPSYLGIVGRNQLLFLGGAFTLGASPGLISSGVAADFAVSAGRTSGVARSLVVAGMHPGRAGGPVRTSDSRVPTSAKARSSHDRSWAPTACSLIVTVAVKPETSGTPAGT